MPPRPRFPVIDGMKTCTRCLTGKPVTEFYEVRKGTGKLFAACKPCTIADQKAASDADPDSAAQYRRAYQDEHREYFQEANRRSYCKHREERLAAIARYRENLKVNHPEMYRKVTMGWAKKHPERLRALCQAWWNEHPDVRAQCIRENNHARRARRRNAFVEKVYFTVIAERDGWTCQLCGEPVDPDLVAQARQDRTIARSHPGYPTLDHIHPLSRAADGCAVGRDGQCQHGLRGGTHEPASVQLAHSSCNTRKWATVSSEIAAVMDPR